MSAHATVRLSVFYKSPNHVSAAAVVAQDLDGRPPYSANPPLRGGSTADVGQICGDFSKRHSIPTCTSRVWRVRFAAPLPSSVGKYDIVSLRDWAASGAEVHNSHFFGGIDGIRSGAARVSRSILWPQQPFHA